MRNMQFSIGKIVFLTLFCMALGTFVIGLVSIFGIQAFRAEFARLVDEDLPQATIATRLNAEISGLTSQVGSLISADSEIALGTIRIQIGDQLAAIDRLKSQLRGFDLRPGDYSEVDTALINLTENLDRLSNLTVEKIRAEAAFLNLRQQAEDLDLSTDERLAFVLWLQALSDAYRIQQLDAVAQDFVALQNRVSAADAGMIGNAMLTQRRILRATEISIQGHLNRHAQLSSQLADSTRFMSSRLIAEANTRSNAILNLFRSNAYLILASFLVFAMIGAFIYIYLDKHVVGRIQLLTRRINAYEGSRGSAPQNQSKNEIVTIEASFDSLTKTITERESRLVALNDAAIDARRDAERANRSKSTLLAAASHDLRQPIHAMGLLIGSVDRGSLDTKSREILDQLADLTKETGQLFNSILDLSKLEAGTFTATREPVNVAELFARVELETAQRAALANAVITITTPEPHLHVLGDSDALYRILSNLVINAIDYAPQGQIALTCNLEGAECVLGVADNGPGLAVGPDGAPASMDGQSAQGYGLGLSISFALASAMKTALSFCAPPSGGTQFRLPLQVVDAMTPAVHALHLPRVTAPRLTDLRVVLLEDNSEIQTITHDHLARLGCRVTSCSTAAQAQTIIADADYKVLLITDMDLGRGHSAAALISAVLTEKTNLIGVIVTTASPNGVSKDLRDRADVQVLEKPFSVVRLASLIRYVNSRR